MSKFLFTLWDGGGEVPPMVSLARAAVGAGHDVTVLADPVLRPEVEAIGAEYRPWTEAPHKHSFSPEEDLTREWEARTPLGAFKRLRDNVAFGPAGAYARDVLREVERRRPDVAVNSVLMFGAQVGAEAARIPQAIVVSTVYVLPGAGAPPFGSGWPPARTRLERARQALMSRMADGLWAKGLPALNAARGELGLAPVAAPIDQPASAERMLVLTSAAFDFTPPHPPANARWVGPRLDDPEWAGAWSPPPGDEPLVLVGMSSTYMAHDNQLRAVVAALGELPVRGVVTLGPAVERLEGEVPANVTVLRSAPHAEVLREAAAVVTHAGHGTAIKALAAGVPVVAMQLGRDQADVAARVVHAGAGVRIKPGAKPERIASALREVLGEERYRAGARRMAAAIASETATDRALGELEAVAARQASSSSSNPASSSTVMPSRSAFSSLEPADSPAIT